MSWTLPFKNFQKYRAEPLRTGWSPTPHIIRVFRRFRNPSEPKKGVEGRWCRDNQRPFGVPSEKADTPGGNCLPGAWHTARHPDGDRWSTPVGEPLLRRGVHDDHGAAASDSTHELEPGWIVARLWCAIADRIDLRAVAGGDCEAVGLDLLNEVVERHDAVGTRPVLDDHSGSARQILGEERRHQAAGAAAGLRADDHGDGLAAKRDLFLNQCWRSGEREENPARRRQQPAHARPL